MMGSAFDHDDRPEDVLVKLSTRHDEYDEPNEPLAELPDYFELMRAPIGSHRLREALTSAGADNVDYYPAAIEASPPRDFGHYYALNVIGRISCMDMGQSKFTTYEDRVARVQNLILDEDSIQGARIFRIHEVPELIIVSDRVAEAIRALSGVALRPAQGWNDDHRY
jgi:hypothetical protein